MKTKAQLIAKILKNANEDAIELLKHANDVADLVNDRFPDEIPDSFVEGQVKSSDSAYLGKFRKPSDTVRLMLDRCLILIEAEKENMS